MHCSTWCTCVRLSYITSTTGQVHAVSQGAVINLHCQAGCCKLTYARRLWCKACWNAAAPLRAKLAMKRSSAREARLAGKKDRGLHGSSQQASTAALAAWTGLTFCAADLYLVRAQALQGRGSQRGQRCTLRMMHVFLIYK